MTSLQNPVPGFRIYDIILDVTCIKTVFHQFNEPGC